MKFIYILLTAAVMISGYNFVSDDDVAVNPCNPEIQKCS